MRDRIIIEKYHPRYQQAINNICYKTGYMGEDLSNLEYFKDKKLFNLVFCYYYITYEPDNCFVAIENEVSRKVIGYIIGSLKSNQVSNRFILRVLPKILIRSVLITSWKYTRSFFQLFNFYKSHGNELEDIQNKYKANFHINILSNYQGMGLGSKLVRKFEIHSIENGVTGIHLSTSSQNQNAIKFYKKLGYKLLHTSPNDLWGLEGVRKVIMGKILD